MNSEINVIADVSAKEGEGDRLWALISTLLVDATRAEQGNLDYQVLRDVDDPAEFVFIERWVDRAVFDRHLASSHVAEYAERSAPLVDRPVRITVCRAPE